MGLSKPPVSTASVESRLVESAIQRTIERKMSKSIPDSAIFMTDTTDDIKRKINKAYCPEGVLEDNPILEYYKYIVFESLDRLGVDKIIISRPEKFGGNVILSSFQDLSQKFANKEIHPADLKASLVVYLDKLIEPVRKHFEENKEAKELLEKVRSFQVTR
jgi:tyrosyl-tRNA synthetase